MRKLNLLRREILNYFFLRKVLKRESSKGPDSEWAKFNLRKNWFGRVYTVINLREEDMGEEEVVRNWKAMELMRPVNEYLTKLDLQELIYPSIEYVPGTNSYLVVYTPLFNYLTTGWLYTFGIFTLTVILGLLYSITLLF